MVHVTSSFSADARSVAKNDLLIQMLTKDPSIVSCDQSQQKKNQESTDQKGGISKPTHRQGSLKACEEYFRMIPEIQASQEKHVLGIKDEIRELDNEIKSLQLTLQSAIRPETKI